MNFFTLIFSFYLLGLSLIPCGEKDECNQKPQTTTIYANRQQEKHGFDSENCTPFCTCSHCTASAFFQPASSYGVKKVGFRSVKYAVYMTHFSSQGSCSIWQPPKLG